MNQTFSLRRKEIVEEQPSVKRMLERWPALFRKQQVFAEFTNVASKDLEWDFFESLDYHTPHFLEIFKSKTGIIGKTLREILSQVETKDTDTIADVTQVPVGVLTVIPENRQQPRPHALHLEPSSIAIILEGNIIMDEIGSHAQAFCVTFGLIYALHLDCPKRLKNTFDFIQRVMLSLGVSNLRPELQSLKNVLLQ